MILGRWMNLVNPNPEKSKTPCSPWGVSIPWGEARPARFLGGLLGRPRPSAPRADALKSDPLTETHLPSLKSCGQKPLAHLTWGVPYGYHSHRNRLGRDNRPKLFRKTNISNDVAGALHPIGGRSGPDTVGLLTFLTLKRLPELRQMICPSDPRSPGQRRYSRAKEGSPTVCRANDGFECQGAV